MFFQSFFALFGFVGIKNIFGFVGVNPLSVTGGSVAAGVLGSLLSDSLPVVAVGVEFDGVDVGFSSCVGVIIGATLGFGVSAVAAVSGAASVFMIAVPFISFHAVAPTPEYALSPKLKNTSLTGFDDLANPGAGLVST